MFHNQQQASPVDQVKAGLLNGVGSQPTLAAVQYVLIIYMFMKTLLSYIITK